MIRRLYEASIGSEFRDNDLEFAEDADYDEWHILKSLIRKALFKSTNFHVGGKGRGNQSTRREMADLIAPVLLNPRIENKVRYIARIWHDIFPDSRLEFEAKGWAEEFMEDFAIVIQARRKNTGEGND